MCSGAQPTNVGRKHIVFGFSIHLYIHFVGMITQSLVTCFLEMYICWFYQYPIQDSVGCMDGSCDLISFVDIIAKHC